MPPITVTRQADGTVRVQTAADTNRRVRVPAGFPVGLGCGHIAPRGTHRGVV